MAGCITKWVTVILGRTWLVASSQGVKSVEICASQRPTFSDTLRPVSNGPDLAQCIHLPWTCLLCTGGFRFNHTALTSGSDRCLFLKRISLPLSLFSSFSFGLRDIQFWRSQTYALQFPKRPGQLFPNQDLLQNPPGWMEEELVRTYRF